MSNKIPAQDTVFKAEELELQKTLDFIQKSYQRSAKELPDQSIDRQILAAAQREILAPNKKQVLKNSLWRKFSLPLYATATFAFTALAIHVLLPTPARVPPGTSAGPVSIDVVNDDRMVEELIKENSSDLESEPRKKLLVPEVEPLQSFPGVLSTEIEMMNGRTDPENQIENFEPPHLNIQMEAGLDGLNQSLDGDLHGDLNSNQANYKIIPDKDLWARQIIKLFKSSDHQKAQNELNRFKQTFPDYPIDEQIEAFKQ